MQKALDMIGGRVKIASWTLDGGAEWEASRDSWKSNSFSHTLS